MGLIRRHIAAFSIFIISAFFTCFPFGKFALGIEIATRQDTWGSLISFVEKPTVTDVQVETHLNITRVLINISRPTNLRYDISSNGTAVFLKFPNVDWIASPFEPRHFAGNVLEFRYSPESNGGRFSILTDGPVSVNKPFLVRSTGTFGHRIVIELVPEAYPGQRLLTQHENKNF